MAFGITNGIVSSIQTIGKPLLPIVWVPLVYAILSSLGLILNFWRTGDILQDEQYHKNPPLMKDGWSPGETFDFIVGKLKL